MASYLYSSNNSPQDRFEQITIVLDNGQQATLRMGLSYNLTATEVARARQFVNLIPSNAQPTPVDNSTSVSAYWKDPVATLDALPITGLHVGDVRLVIAESALRWWTGSSWELLAGGGGGLDGNYIDITYDNDLVTGEMLVWNGTIFETETP